MDVVLSDRGMLPAVSQTALFSVSSRARRLALRWFIVFQPGTIIEEGRCTVQETHGPDGRPCHGPWLGRPETTSTELHCFLAAREEAQFEQPTILGSAWPRERWGVGRPRLWHGNVLNCKIASEGLRDNCDATGLGLSLVREPISRHVHFAGMDGFEIRKGRSRNRGSQHRLPPVR